MSTGEDVVGRWRHQSINITNDSIALIGGCTVDKPIALDSIQLIKVFVFFDFFFKKIVIVLVFFQFSKIDNQSLSAIVSNQTCNKNVPIARHSFAACLVEDKNSLIVCGNLQKKTVL